MATIDSATPGEIAYAAFMREAYPGEYQPWSWLEWRDQHGWDAAAQAVRALQKEETTMQWSHMTNAQARALKDLLRQLGVPVERQYWRQAQTHDNDHTCYVSAPTVREIEAIAQLMKTRTAEDPTHA